MDFWIGKEMNSEKINKRRRELRSCLQSLGEDATNKDIDAVLAEYDKDKDGKIKFDEFQTFMFKQLGDSGIFLEFM